MRELQTFPTLIILFIIRLYQRFISPFTGTNCRFYPSCSYYALQSFSRHNFYLAAKKTLARLAKCHPWHPGGIDLP